MNLSDHIEDSSLGELSCRTAGRTPHFSLFYAVSYFPIPCPPHSQITRLPRTIPRAQKHIHPLQMPCVEGRTKVGDSEKQLATADDERLRKSCPMSQ